MDGCDIVYRWIYPHNFHSIGIRLMQASPDTLIRYIRLIVFLYTPDQV